MDVKSGRAKTRSVERNQLWKASLVWKDETEKKAKKESADLWVKISRLYQPRYVMWCAAVELKEKEHVIQYQLQCGPLEGRMDNIGVWFGVMEPIDWIGYVRDVLGAVRDLRMMGIVHGHINVPQFQLMNGHFVLSDLHECREGKSMRDDSTLTVSFEHDMYAAGQVIRWMTASFGPTTQLAKFDSKLLTNFITQLTPSDWHDLLCPECAFVLLTEIRLRFDA